MKFTDLRSLPIRPAFSLNSISIYSDSLSLVQNFVYMIRNAVKLKYNVNYIEVDGLPV